MKLENLNKYGQYKRDLFSKLNFPFKPGHSVLDVGCGDGTDAVILKDIYSLSVKACDIYKNPNINPTEIDFTVGSILSLPYKPNSFDYVFVHDVLHHVDEAGQSRELHIKALNQLKKIVKKGGSVVIVEANRYNPLFYPHMVKMKGHDHFKQSYFKEIVLEVFPDAEFKYFEAHLYPPKVVWFFKMYEYLMEKFIPARFLAYNVAIINV